MCEDLLAGPIALARQRTTPLAEERRRFLHHLKELGDARNSLHDVACELVVIVRRLDRSGDGLGPVAAVDAAAPRWAMEQMRRRRRTKAAISTRNFRYWATPWLRCLGRIQERAPVAAPPFQALRDGFTADMTDEQGVSPYSGRSPGGKTKTFLGWSWSHGRVFADVTIQEVDHFVMANGRARWSRRSVALAVPALRAFFRDAERRQPCHAGMAAAITGPRRFDLETRPSGPSWADVDVMIASLATNHAADIRRLAALVLFATSGFRAGEVAELTLDDLDWEPDVIRMRRAKRHDVQTSP